MKTLMKLLVLARWELVQTARGAAPHLALTLTAFASAGLVGVGIILLNDWSPFPSASNVFRFGTPSASPLMTVVGEYRGGIIFLGLLVWLLALAALAGPAFSAGAIVRDRRSGRLDRVLTDAHRAEVVAVAKLVTGLIPLGIVLATCGPSVSFAWLLGGLATPDALASIGVLLAAAVLVAATGLVCSALATSEVTALVASYLALGGLFLGPLVTGAALILAGSRAAATTILSVDPFIALLSVQGSLTSALTRRLLSDGPSLRLTWAVGHARVPVWTADIVLYALVAVALVWLTSVAIEPLHPIKTWRLRRLRGVR